jgi:hypothetical protein
MDRLLTVVNLMSIALLLLVLINVRRERIRVEYSVSWLAAAVALFALTWSPRPTAWISSALGIDGGPSVLVIMILTAFLGVFYRFTRVISNLKDNNVALAQRVAVLEYLISSLHGKEAEAQTGGAGRRNSGGS